MKNRSYFPSALAAVKLQESHSLDVYAGVNSSIKFYCEAKNTRGVSVSRTGTVHIKGETACLLDPDVHELLQGRNNSSVSVCLSVTSSSAGPAGSQDNGQQRYVVMETRIHGSL